MENKTVTREQVSKADAKELRSIAAGLSIAFIGKKIEDLRAECLGKMPEEKKAPAKKDPKPAPNAAVARAMKQASDKKAVPVKKTKSAPAKKETKPAKKEETKKAPPKVKPAKKEAKPAKAVPVKKEKKAKVKAEPQAKAVPVSDTDMKKVKDLETKKAQILTLHELGYGPTAIGIAVVMHPTNVCRYLRDAGLSTSNVTVPKERKDRIRATINAKKAEESK